MGVTETLMAAGQWSLKVRPDTPAYIVDQLGYFGHVAVSVGRVDPRTAGDGILSFARYVGVLRGVTFDEQGYSLSGAGLATWLGDEDKKGGVLESLQTFTAQTFPTVVRALLPPAVVEGTLHSVPGTYTGTHQWQSPREAIQYVCDTMGAEWRVNNDASLDAGLVADLYRTTPAAAIVKREAGRDMALIALPGRASLAEDVADFTTRVVLLAQGTGASTATGTADISPALNPYKDLHGNTLVRTRLVSESSTDTGNAAARAQLALNQFTAPRDALTLNTSEYDIKGSVVVGDYVWVWDPDAQLVDTTNEIRIRGRIINPVKLRVRELTWPIARGMGVAYRDINGTWYDLTDYVQWESGTTSVVVGGYNRSLISTAEAVGGRPQPDTSVPAPPVFAPFASGTYQSDATGHTKAFIQVNWAEPLNVDGSSITDGNYYEIRWRTSDTPIYPIKWQDLTAYKWGELAGNTWARPLTFETERDWHYIQVAWGQTTFNVHELTPAVSYDWQIRAVDSASPPNVGAFSATTTYAASVDTIPPATPAPPVVAGSRISVQVTHTLGQAAGGTFNLDPDLHHLEVHAEYEPLFTPSDLTLLGKVLANAGMISAGIPAVQTFPVESTGQLYVKVIAVDESGNKSSPSTPATVTALLVDDAHISDLTVSKVTAGTITAAWVLAGSIKTATVGQRVEMNSAGLQLYDSDGNLGVAVSPNDDAYIKFQTTDADSHYSRLWSLVPNTIELSVRKRSDDTIDGGKLLLTNLGDASGGAVNLSAQYNGADAARIRLSDTLAHMAFTDGTNDYSYIQVDSTSGVDLVTFDVPGGSVNSWIHLGTDSFWNTIGRLPFFGNNSNGNTLGVKSADIGAGFTGITMTFANTQLTAPTVVATVFDISGTQNVAWLSSLSGSGATIKYSVSNAVRVMAIFARN
jgi:hypothetical protein